MAGGGGSGHSSAPVPVFPSLSDDGQAAHSGGAGVPVGRCGEGISALCLYRELLRVQIGFPDSHDMGMRKGLKFQNCLCSKE